MSNVFIVSNTQGTLTITIPPGEVNGSSSGAAPGSAGYLTDLKLHGMGVMRWGEGLNESILRVAETFACEEKSGSPGTPKDSGDLGGNLGINAPIAGQQWFNLSNDKLYVYNGSDWLLSGAVSTGTTAPTTPQEGDMWYNTGTSGNPCNAKQLMVYNGSVWRSVAHDYLSLCGGALVGGLSMSGNSITNLGPPTFPTDAVNLQTLSDEINFLSNDLNNYLPLAGGQMNSGSTIYWGSHLFFNEGNGNVNAAPDIRASGDIMISTQNSFRVTFDDDNSASGVFLVTKGAQQATGVTELFRIENGGRMLVPTGYESLVNNDRAVPNKRYVDDKAEAEAAAAEAAAIAAAGSGAEDYANDNFYAQQGVTGNGPRVWVNNFAPTTQGDNGDIWFEL